MEDYELGAVMDCVFILLWLLVAVVIAVVIGVGVIF